MNTWSGDNDCVSQDFELLGKLGVLPACAELAVYSAATSHASGLVAVWKEWLRTAPKNRRSKAARIHSSLQVAHAAGAELTFDLPGCDRKLSGRWLGRRAYWWPRGVNQSRCIGIVSSRLKRSSASNTSVIRALRLTLPEIDIHSERLIASTGTSLCEYLEQCAKLFELPLLRVSSPHDRRSSPSWLEMLISSGSSGSSPQLVLSPAVLHANEPAETEASTALIRNVPVRDRIVAVLSHRLFVLSLRREGNWWKLLQAGFRERHWEGGSVRAVVGEGLCSETIADALQNSGVVRWYISAHDPDGSTPGAENEHHDLQSVTTNTAVASDPTLLKDALAAEDILIDELARPSSSTEWLIHWTREAHAEWTGESRDDYLTSILLSDGKDDRTAFGVVRRMMQEQLIRASAGNTRTGADVVCLSGTPLIELIAQRIFRSHRGRWDFEHYGIGVRTSHVRSLGGRQVIYGDESTWQALPEGERLWFHPQQTGADQNQSSDQQAGSERIDWTIENEWRLAGDLRLEAIPQQDVFVYCATEHEAVQLRAMCTWRVVSVEKLRTAQ